MLSCINKSSYEFQTLKQRSGLNEFILEAICRRFVTEYDRFPYLDELPNSNSEESLREALQIKDNSAKIQDILSFTGRDNIEEAFKSLIKSGRPDIRDDENKNLLPQLLKPE